MSVRIINLLKSIEIERQQRNLSRHLDVLQEAGLVEAWRGTEGGRPQTLYRLSAEGRARFVAYLEELEQVVRDAMPKAQKRPERAPDLPPGFQPA